MGGGIKKKNSHDDSFFDDFEESFPEVIIDQTENVSNIRKSKSNFIISNFITWKQNCKNRCDIIFPIHNRMRIQKCLYTFSLYCPGVTIIIAAIVGIVLLAIEFAKVF